MKTLFTILTFFTLSLLNAQNPQDLVNVLTENVQVRKESFKNFFIKNGFEYKSENLQPGIILFPGTPVLPIHVQNFNGFKIFFDDIGKTWIYIGDDDTISFKIKKILKPIEKNITETGDEWYTNLFFHPNAQNIKPLADLHQFFESSLNDEAERQILSAFRQIGFDNRIQCEKKCFYGNAEKESQISLICDNGLLKEIVLESSDEVLMRDTENLIAANTALRILKDDQTKNILIITNNNSLYSISNN